MRLLRLSLELQLVKSLENKENYYFFVVVSVLDSLNERQNSKICEYEKVSAYASLAEFDKKSS